MRNVPPGTNSISCDELRSNALTASPLVAGSRRTGCIGSIGNEWVESLSSAGWLRGGSLVTECGGGGGTSRSTRRVRARVASKTTRLGVLVRGPHARSVDIRAGAHGVVLAGVGVAGL